MCLHQSIFNNFPNRITEFFINLWRSEPSFLWTDLKRYFIFGPFCLNFRCVFRYKHHIVLKLRIWPEVCGSYEIFYRHGRRSGHHHVLALTRDLAADRVLRLRRIKLPSGVRAHRGSGTILGELICPQQQQVAFWEDQHDGRFLPVKSDSLCGSKQQVWPEAWLQI